jgi:hypothetical protein
MHAEIVCQELLPATFSADAPPAFGFVKNSIHRGLCSELQLRLLLNAHVVGEQIGSVVPGA